MKRATKLFQRSLASEAARGAEAELVLLSMASCATSIINPGTSLRMTWRSISAVWASKAASGLPCDVAAS